MIVKKGSIWGGVNQWVGGRRMKRVTGRNIVEIHNI
jgi:hypothetical protein